MTFLLLKTITSCLEHGQLQENERRKAEVVSNRNIMERIVDTIMLLGKQGLAFRGHCKLLANDVLNTGNFLEVLKFLATYDVTIRDHLAKVRMQQRQEGRKGLKGR